jgi:sugar diacid utilization regulator
MLSSGLQATELLKFMPEQGKVLLNNSRITLFDVSTIGLMRKDLIETLGMERAKGFYIRNGWACGFQAAMDYLKQFGQHDEEQEGAFSGPFMHTLQGFGLAELSYKYDQTTGMPYYEGSWVNSYEAEQHILHFGLHHEPVCWHMVGYASGYSSARLGKKIVYIEYTCVGKGDDKCTYIGKAVEDWGEDIASELAYYEINKISEELAQAHEKIKKQNKILGKIVNIHEQLTQYILNGKGIKEITNGLSELMNCTVVMEDCNLRLRSFCMAQKESNGPLLTACLPIHSSLMFNDSPEFYIKHKRPFQLIDDYSGTVVYRLVSPVLVGQELLGFVSLMRLDRRFADLDFVSLEHAASVFALKILEERKMAEVERRLQGDFVDDLLTGSFTDDNSIINRARGLNYDITQPHRVVVLDINDFSQTVNSFKHSEERIFQFKTELLNFVKSCLKCLGNGMVVNKSDNLILFLRIEESDNSEKFARQISEKILAKLLDRFPKVNFTIGIGSICLEPAHFHNSFQSAQKAVEIGKTLKRQGEVVSLEQFSAHALLDSALNPADLNRFAATQIGSLLKYDRIYQTELIPTLKEFIDHRGNAERTARTMNLSIGGLKYRLQRIEEISGHDLKDSKVFFNLSLALNIFQLTGEQKIIDF